MGVKRRYKKKCLGIIICIVSTCFTILLWLIVTGKMTSKPKNVMVISNRQKIRPIPDLQKLTPQDAPEYRLWHLDLKGAPPKISYIEKVLKLVKSAGATGVLVEWEDMFPFSGKIANFSAKNAYNIVEVKKLYKVINDLELLYIPLVQSLGHLEYVLKQQTWRHLRESDNMPAEACPSNPETMSLVLEAIRQIVDLTPSAVLHIGADEVFNLGKCPKCLQSGKSSLSLYVNYIKNLAKTIKDTWSLRILIWDDMIRSTPTHLVKELTDLVEPVVWAYGENVLQLLPPLVIQNHMQNFPNVWMGAAFKGAFGPTEVMPNAHRHSGNTVAWSEISKIFNRYSGPKINGMIITGWSRYDHFATLCELLPPSIPSLIFTMIVATTGQINEDTIDTLHNLLKCSPKVYLAPSRDPHLWAARDCHFEGSDISRFLHRYVTLKTELHKLSDLVEEKEGWFTSYNFVHRFSSPIKNLKISDELKNHKYEIDYLKTEISKIFPKYFDNFTITEWQEQHLKPLDEKITFMIHKTEILLSQSVWPRRPL